MNSCEYNSAKRLPTARLNQLTDFESASSTATIAFLLSLTAYIHFYSASALLAMQSAVLARGILSVRLSVHPSRSGIVSRRMKIRSCGFQHLVAQSLLVSGEVKSIRIFAGDHPQ